MVDISDNRNASFVLQAPSLTCEGENVAVEFLEKDSFDSILHIFIYFSAANVAFGVILNLIGFGICTGIGFKGTLFAYYFQAVFFKNVLLIMFIHIRHSTLLTYTTDVIMYPETWCTDFFYWYVWASHDQVCSICLLCVNRIRSQTTKVTFDNLIDTLRWPFLLNVMFSLSLTIPVMHYKFIRNANLTTRKNTKELTWDERCFLTFSRPNCGDTTSDWVLTYLPSGFDILTVVLLLLLFIEIFFKKRRWAKQSNNLATDTSFYSNVGNDDIENVDIGETSRRRSITSAFDDNLWMTFQKPLSNRRKTFAPFLSRGTLVSSVKTLYMADTIVTPVAKTNMTIALILVNLLVRLPRTLLLSPFIDVPWKLEENALIATDLVYQFGMVIPALVVFIWSPYYRHAANTWLFDKDDKVANPRLTQEEATETRDRLLHQSNNVLTEADIDDADSVVFITDIPDILGSVGQSLTTRTEQIDRQRNIIKILTGDKEVDLEEFPKNISTDLPDIKMTSKKASVSELQSDGVQTPSDSFGITSPKGTVSDVRPIS